MQFAGGVADFMGVPVVRCTTAQFISGFTDTIAAGDMKHPLLVTYLNAWCSNLAASDPEYTAILRDADAVYADGQAIVWASALLGQAVPERVNAADFIVDFCRTAADKGISIYLLGSAEGVAECAGAKLKQSVPGLKMLGTASGYFAGTEETVIARIAAAAPDLLLVGMGVPMQEKWVKSHLGRLNVRAVWCVGAMFEYYGDARARAPVWIRRAGLEWLFRLVLEPRRLWRRYLVGNVVFIARVIRAAVSGGGNTASSG
jgi:N-acetylglucosaminyldiphosphoundecaprenol N-acetyl-beta-D-mannosaminyltransferase